MRGKQALKNLISNVLLQAITAVSGLLLPRLYLLAYGSAMNGMVSSATQFMSYLALLESGIGAASIVTLYEPLANNDQNRINGILSATRSFYNQTGVAYAMLVCVLAFTFPYLIQEQISSTITREIVIILSLSNLIDYLFLGKYRVLLNADQRGYIVVGAQAIGMIFNTAVSILLIQLKFPIVFVKSVATIVYMLRAIFIYWYVKKRYAFLDCHVKPLKESLTQRWSALIHQVAGVVLNNSNLIIMTVFGGAKSLLEISVYTIYQMVSNMVTMVFASISNALTPGFGQIISTGQEDIVRKAYSEYEFIYQILLFVAYICMGVLFIPFVSLYTQGIHDVNYIRLEIAVLFTLIGILQNVRVPGITLICAAGHYKQTQKRAMLEAIINLLVAMLLIKQYGLVGVLYGTVCAFVYSVIHVLWYCNKWILKHSLKQTLFRLGRNVILAILCLKIAQVTKIHSIASQSYLAWVICAAILILLSSVIFVVGNGLVEPKAMKAVLVRGKRLFLKQQ